MDQMGKRVPVMAKLEKPEAVSDLPAIVDAFDGVMVARGDLGVEMPLEQVRSCRSGPSACVARRPSR
jgi:pyruvate kinase